MDAEIIAVGSELLTPQHTDTNSLFLTERLNSLGVLVRFKTIVGDSREDLARVLRAALERSPLIVLIGGLGPTDDDLTRDVVAEVLGRSLREDAELRRRIETRFARLGRTMPDNNLRQARVPEGGEWLENRNGTAPGIWIKHNDNILVLLPGPPRELEPMFDATCLPRLERVASGERIKTRVYKVLGRSVQISTAAGLKPSITISSSRGSKMVRYTSRRADNTVRTCLRVASIVTARVWRR